MNARTGTPGEAVFGLANEQYHAMRALGNSGLSALAESPAHYRALYLATDRPQREATAAMRAGTLAHCAILEPSKLIERYVVRPAGLDLRTKAGKEWSATLDSAVELLTVEEHNTAQSQRAAVLAVPELAALLTAGAAEVSIFWTDAETGVPCKCRPDFVHPLPDGRVILVDLKTTASARPDAFSRSVWTYGYHRQAAWYTAGYEHATGEQVAGFVFATVSNAYPFIAQGYMLDDEAMTRGAEACRSLVRLYSKCVGADDWPAYSRLGIEVLSLPKWAAYQPTEGETA